MWQELVNKMNANLSPLKWVVVQTHFPPIVESDMTIEEKVEYRRLQRVGKNFGVADRLRKELEENLVFINDLKDGKQEVYYLTEAFFNGMHKIKRNHKETVDKITDAESRMKALNEIDLEAIAEIEKELVPLRYILSELEKNKSLHIFDKRAYFDYRVREDIKAEAYFQAWLDRTLEQINRK